MATPRKHESSLSQAFVNASLALIVLIPLDLILMTWVSLSGLRYISTGEPSWHNLLTRVLLVVLMYVVPPLLFTGAGFFIGKRFGRDGAKNGVLFGFMWTGIIFLAIQVMFGVLLLTGVRNPHVSFMETWIRSFIMTCIAGAAISALSAIGGVVGEKYRSK